METNKQETKMLELFEKFKKDNDILESDSHNVNKIITPVSGFTYLTFSYLDLRKENVKDAIIVSDDYRINLNGELLE